MQEIQNRTFSGPGPGPGSTAIVCRALGLRELKGSPGRPVPEERPEEKAETEEEHHIICRNCGWAITRPEKRITVDGAHRHTFANPHGLLFEIGCFRSAEGCVLVGPATDEFTWFKGFFWRIAVCRQCGIHMGWRFESAGLRRFTGLILDRLVEWTGRSE